MVSQTGKETGIDKIDSIINNPLLAEAICKSIMAAIDYRPQLQLDGKTVWRIFKKSLDGAIYNIETHKRSPLFKRLIEFGPYNPDDPEMLVNDQKTTLSDPESGSCVQFIYSHMVNRFKGELAELLALEPCIELVKSEGKLPEDTILYWGNKIRERTSYER